MRNKNARISRPSAREREECPATALIREAAARRRGIALPQGDWKTALQKLCDHNDSTSDRSKLVGVKKAAEMLRTHYNWSGSAREAVDSLCREFLGRTSYGSK